MCGVVDGDGYGDKRHIPVGPVIDPEEQNEREFESEINGAMEMGERWGRWRPRPWIEQPTNVSLSWFNYYQIGHTKWY